MGRRKKRLVDLVRDETFLARKDEMLLAGRDELPWPALEDYRERWQAAPRCEELGCSQRLHDGCRYEIARELELASREPDAQPRLLGELQAELRKLGEAGSYEQLVRFAPRFFRHQEGDLAGRPYHFPPNHKAFLREFWRRDEHGHRVYDAGLLMEPKGCSKTPSMTIVGTHALVSQTDAPIVSQISGAKYQANLGHRFARRNIEEGALAAWLSVGGRIIECPEHKGEFEIVSAEGDFSAGANPTAGLFDELFTFRHRNQREAWRSQREALHKREGRSFVLAISTAGWNKNTLLGEMYDDAVAHPNLEVLEDGYHLRLRDVDAGFLFWCHQAPEDADIEDPEVVRRATPAPWINPLKLIRTLNASDTDELDWRRLHLNQWTAAKSSWLSSGVWERLRV